MIKARKAYSIIFLCFLNIAFFSQINLVPNPSFETYSTCPWNKAQLPYTVNWLNCGASVEYFNSCAGGAFVSVPLNFVDYQAAADGNGYIGLIAYSLHDNGTSPIYNREPAGTSLTQSLSIGTKYYVSFKASLALNDFESCCATDKLGVKFSTIPYSPSNPTPVNNFAHIYSNLIISDTLNWTVVKGSFVADSAYSFVSIGNFFDSLSTQVVDYFNNYPNTYASYYYVDDVRLSTDSIYGLAINVNDLNLDNKLGIYPNPLENHLFLKYFNQFKNFKLHDLLGNEVKFEILKDKLDLSNVSPGIYFLFCERENKVYKSKIIKK